MVMHQLGGACDEGLEDEEDDVDGGKSCEMNIVEKIYSLLLLISGLEESLVMESASDVQLVGDWWSLEKRTYGGTQVEENERHT